MDLQLLPRHTRTESVFHYKTVMLADCLIYVSIFLFMSPCCSYSWTSIQLPDEHIPYFFYNNPGIKKSCQHDYTCPYQSVVHTKKCWGYERTCSEDMQMSSPQCPESSTWANTKADQIELFWDQGDFGHLRKRMHLMKHYCRPLVDGDSSLACDPFIRHCKATNLYMDFRKHSFDSHDRFQENIFKGGLIGGHCDFSAADFKREGEHKSALQSWFGELEDYVSLDFQPVDTTHCDILIARPTYFMKLDAGINMYHHFCDFVNLYGSQHMNNSFSTDINIIMWDTSNLNYFDLFSITWKVFTDHPVLRLNSFAGKRVCFKNAVFPMLPRQRFGLYYNMPVVPGCYGSSLFRAFSQHVLHRLNVSQDSSEDKRIRVTLLSRKSQYRNILNEDELVSALKTVREYQVQSVQYHPDHLSFFDQLKVTHNSDIFIGMHGAGLTHVLFQPDWGVLIELYNCEDTNCYKDLARLRGIKYMTWERANKIVQQDKGHHPTLGDHAKFTNYRFDIAEFLRLVAKAADHVRSHPAFIKRSQPVMSATVREDL